MRTSRILTSTLAALLLSTTVLAENDTGLSGFVFIQPPQVRRAIPFPFPSNRPNDPAR